MKEFFKKLNVVNAIKNGKDDGFYFIMNIFVMFFVMFTFALPFGLSALGYKLFVMLIIWTGILTFVVNTQIEEKED